MWREVFPAKGEASGKAAWVAMSVAGLFRALVITALWLIALSVRSRIQAGVGLALVLLVLLIGADARAAT
jgi:hypothetical protein